MAMTNFFKYSTCNVKQIALSYSLQNRTVSVFEARTCCYVFTTQ